MSSTSVNNVGDDLVFVVLRELQISHNFHVDFYCNLVEQNIEFNVVANTRPIHDAINLHIERIKSKIDHHEVIYEKFSKILGF